MMILCMSGFYFNKLFYFISYDYDYCYYHVLLLIRIYITNNICYCIYNIVFFLYYVMYDINIMKVIYYY